LEFFINFINVCFSDTKFLTEKKDYNDLVAKKSAISPHYFISLWNVSPFLVNILSAKQNSAHKFRHSGGSIRHFLYNKKAPTRKFLVT